MPEKASVLVLLSGGMDSVTALHHAAGEHRVIGAVSFDYGSKHNARELPMARHHAEQIGARQWVIPLGFMDQHFKSDLLRSGGEVPDGHYEEQTMQQTVVPFRNGIMLAIAAGLAESWQAGALVIAAHAGDHAIYPDCREDFMRPMGKAIRAGTYAGIEVLRPFINLRKEDIVRRGTELGIDYRMTWSCYKGGDRHCGRCGTCVERREAFKNAGVPDPTDYEHLGPLPEKPVRSPQKVKGMTRQASTTDIIDTVRPTRARDRRVTGQ